MEDRFGSGFAQGEFLELALTKHQGNYPVDVKQVKGLVKFPWFQDLARLVRTFSKHRLNQRNTKSNQKKIRRKVRLNGLVTRARAPPVVVWTYDVAKQSECFPLGLLTWGNLITCVYLEIMALLADEFKSVVIERLLHSGLQVAVVVLSYRIPDSVSSFIILYDNTFHDGMSDSVSEWFELLLAAWAPWRQHKKANKLSNGNPQKQLQLRNEQLKFFQDTLIDGHPMQVAVGNSWTFLNQLVQVVKGLAPKYFARFENEEDSDEEGTAEADARQCALAEDPDLRLVFEFKRWWEAYVDSCNPHAPLHCQQTCKGFHIILMSMTEASKKCKAFAFLDEFMPVLYFELIKFSLPHDKDAFTDTEALQGDDAASFHFFQQAISSGCPPGDKASLDRILQLDMSQSETLKVAKTFWPNMGLDSSSIVAQPPSKKARKKMDMNMLGDARRKAAYQQLAKAMQSGECTSMNFMAVIQLVVTVSAPDPSKSAQLLSEPHFMAAAGKIAHLILRLGFERSLGIMSATVAKLSELVVVIFKHFRRTHSADDAEELPSLDTLNSHSTIEDISRALLASVKGVTSDCDLQGSTSSQSLGKPLVASLEATPEQMTKAKSFISNILGMPIRRVSHVKDFIEELCDSIPLDAKTAPANVSRQLYTLFDADIVDCSRCWLGFWKQHQSLPTEACAYGLSSQQVLQDLSVWRTKCIIHVVKALITEGCPLPAWFLQLADEDVQIVGAHDVGLVGEDEFVEFWQCFLACPTAAAAIEDTRRRLGMSQSLVATSAATPARGEHELPEPTPAKEASEAVEENFASEFFTLKSLYFFSSSAAGHSTQLPSFAMPRIESDLTALLRDLYIDGRAGVSEYLAGTAGPKFTGVRLFENLFLPKAIDDKKPSIFAMAPLHDSLALPFFGTVVRNGDASCMGPLCVINNQPFWLRPLGKGIASEVPSAGHLAANSSGPHPSTMDFATHSVNLRVTTSGKVIGIDTKLRKLKSSSSSPSPPKVDNVVLTFTFDIPYVKPNKVGLGITSGAVQLTVAKTGKTCADGFSFKTWSKSNTAAPIATSVSSALLALSDKDEELKPARGDKANAAVAKELKKSLKDGSIAHLLL